MDNTKKPEGYPTVMPYLILKHAANFFLFTQNVFGAKEAYREMRDDKVLRHGEVRIGDSIIMFAESTEQFAPSTAGMFVYVENADETYQKALKEGAVSIMPPADQSYGRSCGVSDPFGNTWWITST